MSPSSFEALDCFLLSQYLSLELFKFFFFTSSCNFFVSVQFRSDLITLLEGPATSSSPSAKSEEERTSTPQEADGRFRVGFCCASGGSSLF